MYGKYDIDKLGDACRRGDVATVKACLARGVNINSNSPLMTAVCSNQLRVVRILLARDDLDIAATTYNGSSALHLACHKGYADCVALLGKDRRMTRRIINIKCRWGYTALMDAVDYGYLSCVEEMAKLDGVDWETKNKKGKSLEDVARAENDFNILRYLAKRKLGLAIVAPVKPVIAPVKPVIAPVKPVIAPVKTTGVKTRSEKLKEISGNIQALDENLELENKGLILKQAQEKEELDQKQEKDRTVFDEKQTKELEEFTKKT
jgi:hypothetical protein